MPETRPTLRRIVHVTEAPLGGVVTYLDELVGAQLRSLPDVQIDLITPEINRDALAGLSGPRFNLIAFRHPAPYAHIYGRWLWRLTVPARFYPRPAVRPDTESAL